MDTLHTVRPVARIHSDFPTKFGIPRQSGLVRDLEAIVVFEPEFQNPDMLRGIEDFNYIWLLWQFSESAGHGWSPTVRPPRLGGNRRLGVFATRSPFRPNPIGLSPVRLLSVEETQEYGTVLRVSGADLMDGTPILDIKPYVPYVDCIQEATGGFTDRISRVVLSVDCPSELLDRIPLDKRSALMGVLSQDPRPAYHDDPERIYGLGFGGMDVGFTVEGTVLHVVRVEKI